MSSATTATATAVSRSPVKEITYYVITRETMDDIIYYCSPDNNRYLSYEDEQLLEKLNVNDIHFDNNNAINQYHKIFSNVYASMIGENSDEELTNDIYLIMKALEDRKQAIKDITFDVLKKRAIAGNVCGNL
jgi:predicted nucleotidyltransferase